MNILILGGNDGSHMLAQLLLEYPDVNKVFHFGAYTESIESDRYIPMSDCTIQDALEVLDFPELDLVIPVQLYYLLWDEFQNKIKEKNIPCLGPSREIAMLEWSRVLSKSLLKELEIPTPSYKIYNLENLITDFLNIKRPFVFKYDRDDRIGLQTVIVTDENFYEEYEVLKNSGNTRVGFYKTILGSKFNPNFIVEEFIQGKREYSYHAICNKSNWEYIGSARDYKRRFDNDVGFNTVGLGSYAGVEINPVVHDYVDKILNHLRAQGKEWVGILYLGIMEDSHGNPIVLEINTRFGNPESQVILPLLNNNLKDLFYKTASNERIEPISFNNQAAVSLRIIHKDYPNASPTTQPILPEQEDLYINYPATRIVFNSSVVALGKTTSEASDKIYAYLKDIEMHDFTYRHDIGYLK